ncbi:MAG: PadR family transcriptional regulator [bacterium]|nr:PadR family transcriptional regulator [bacterium]
MKSLTVFEETVMLGIYRLKGNAYSVTIHQEIMRMTGEDVIVGTLFNALKQLGKKGYLNKSKGRPLNDRGGKDIMYYNISKDGYRALEKTRDLHAKIWNEIPEVLYKGT